MDPAAVLRIHVLASTAAANASLAKTDAQLRKTSATASGTSAALGSKMAKAAKLGAVGLAVGLGAALVGASKKARDFEKQMSNLGAVADANTRQMKRLEKQALKLGAATQFSATEAAQAQIELAKGGLAVKQILGGGLQAALALAAAGELELAQAGETVVNTMGLFALKGKDAMKIADMLATAANKTTTDVADLAMSLKMGGAVAKQAGYDLNNTVQVLEALAESGVKNSDAGTSMKSAMIALLNPTAKQTKLAKQLGLNWIGQNGSMKSAVQISKQLRTATDGMTKAERTKTFAVLAGTDGFRTLAALYDTGPKKLEAYGKANAKQGEAARVAAKKMDNLEGDLEELSGAWETLQIQLGGPVNKAVRKVVTSLTDLLNVVNKYDLSKMDTQLKAIEAKSEDVRDAVRIATDAWKVLGPAVTAALGIVRAKARSIAGIVEGLARIVRGAMKIIAGILRGDWSRAWEGAKDIASGAVKTVVSTIRGFRDTLRSIFNGVRDIMRNIFGDAWGKVEDIFRTGANAVIDVVNTVIGVINKIPGVPDIGTVGSIGGSGVTRRQRTLDSKRDKSVVSGPMGRQRGGSIFGGKPSGDSIPAMLERGEYVLNRKAVRAIGARQLDAINFGAAPRFQKGGFLGEAVGKVVGAARDMVGKGAGFFLKQLPQPNLPQPFTGLGPHIIDNVTDWIRGKVPKAAGAVDLGSAPPRIRAAMALAQKMGLSITSGFPLGTPGAHADNSWHYQSGRAFDTGGSAANMMAYALAAVKRWGGTAKEIYHTPLGYSIKNGARTGLIAAADHHDHVHVAMQKGGKVGKKMRGGGFLGGQRMQDHIDAITAKRRARKNIHGVMGTTMRMFGLKRRPRVGFHKKDGIALASNHRGWVSFGPKAIRAMADPWAPNEDGSYGGHNWEKGTVLHELAHVNQKPGVFKRLALREGGAEAFAQLAAPIAYKAQRIPFSYEASGGKYPAWSDKVMKDKGVPWVLRGQFRKFQKGGKVTGRVSYFNDGTTASGISAAAKAGLALNLKPGTDSGWNNPTTQGWISKARAGKPVYGRVNIAGKSAVMPVIDLGPAGWTGRAIDVTQKGLEKMGFTTANFPTDAVGSVSILGGIDAVKRAGKARSSTGSKRRAKAEKAPGKIGNAIQLTSPADKPAKLGKVASQLPKSIQRLLKSPGISGAGRMAAADMAVTLSEVTEGIDDDKLALQYRIGLNRRRAAKLNKQLGNINKRLAGRSLKPADRKRLKARRDRILGDLGGLKSDIISDRTAIGGLATGSDDTAPDPMAEAIAAQAEAMRLLAEAQRELAEEKKRENDRAQHITAITGREAMRAMSDFLSGQIAGRTRMAPASGANTQQVRI